MIKDGEEISVINRTDKKMRVTLVVEEEYTTYMLDAKGWRCYDDYNYPKKRKIKVLLDEASGGEE